MSGVIFDPVFVNYRLQSPVMRGIEFEVIREVLGHTTRLMSLVLLYCAVQSTLTTGRGVMSNSVRLGSFGILRLILCISLPVTSVAFAQNAAARPSVPWPTKGWTKGGFLQTSVSKANS